MLPQLERNIAGLVLWSCGRHQRGIVSFLPQKSASDTEASSVILLGRAAWQAG